MAGSLGGLKPKEVKLSAKTNWVGWIENSRRRTQTQDLLTPEPTPTPRVTKFITLFRFWLQIPTFGPGAVAHGCHSLSTRELREEDSPGG